MPKETQPVLQEPNLPVSTDGKAEGTPKATETKDEKDGKLSWDDLDDYLDPKKLVAISSSVLATGKVVTDLVKGYSASTQDLKDSFQELGKANLISPNTLWVLLALLVGLWGFSIHELLLAHKRALPKVERLIAMVGLVFFPFFILMAATVYLDQEKDFRTEILIIVALGLMLGIGSIYLAVHLTKPSFQRLALGGMFLGMLMAGSGTIYANSIQRSEDKMKIIVTKIVDSEGKDSYLLTDMILQVIRKELSLYPNVQVEFVDDTITEEEGSEKAWQIGKETEDEAVIWGSYKLLDDKVAVNLHFEVVDAQIDFTFNPGKRTYEGIQSWTLADFKNLTAQRELASGILFLSQVLIGVTDVRYAYALDDDYDTTVQKAVFAITSALSQTEIPLSFQSIGHANRCYAYRIQGKYDKALADCNIALSLVPQNLYALVVRGTVYAEKGDLTKAFADLNKALELNPFYVFGYARRGSVYLANGQFTEAITDLDQIIKRVSNFRYAFLWRGIAYAQIGDNLASSGQPPRCATKDECYAKARTDFEKALNLESHDLEALAWLGYVNRFLPDLNEALDRKPTFSQRATYYYLRGLVKAEKQQKEAALTDLQEALKLGRLSAFNQERAQSLIQELSTTK